MESRAYNMDCLIGMKQFPDKYFELAIVDPPYGIKANKFGFGRHKGKTLSFDRGEDWDSAIPDKEYFEELFRVSKNQIIWGGNYFTEHLPPRSCWLCWNKRVATGMSFAHFELAWTSFTSPAREVRFRYSGAGGVKTSNYISKIHPTQKPIELYLWLIENYTSAGDKILDTHLGSGSSRIAAHQLGYDFTGYEMNKKYFDLQEKRFDLVTSQTQLTFKTA